MEMCRKPFKNLPNYYLYEIIRKGHFKFDIAVAFKMQIYNEKDEISRKHS